MQRFLSTFPLLLLTVCALTAEARAEPVRTATSGFITIRSGGFTFFNSYSLSGAGFTTDGGREDEDYPGPCTDLFDCRPGDIVDFTYSNYGFGSGRIDDVISDGSSTDCSADFTIRGGQHRLPDTLTPFSMTFPMSLSGGLNIFDPAVGQSLAAIRIRGQGVVTIDFIADPEEGVLFFDKVQFTVKPIPEPATLLLLGTGLAGVGGMIRTRRNTKCSEKAKEG